jgi:hypothetical protein
MVSRSHIGAWVPPARDRVVAVGSTRVRRWRATWADREIRCRISRSCRWMLRRGLWWCTVRRDGLLFLVHSLFSPILGAKGAICAKCFQLTNYFLLTIRRGKRTEARHCDATGCSQEAVAGRARAELDELSPDFSRSGRRQCTGWTRRAARSGMKVSSERPVSLQARALYHHLL